MCLYEIKLKNPKYLPSIKNGGKPTAPKDNRLLYINVGCGWCYECRKRLANDWKTRLKEELKEYPNAEFVCLTFSPEAINENEKNIIKTKYKDIEGDNTDVNILASFTIRRFAERWRKKFKKNPHYWLITELGHHNTKRIHLHGIIFNTSAIEKRKFQNLIQEKWNYGNVDFGEYCNEKSINYIMKYVTKIDTVNKGYRQKIFTSKKIGIGYLKKSYIHKYKGEETIQYYKDSKGYITALPRYYKEKIWNDEERENLRLIEEEKETLSILNSKVKKDTEKVNKALQGARESNKKAGYSDALEGNRRYLITEAMKQKGDYDTRWEKEVRSEKKREITKYAKMPENNDKSSNTEYTIKGKYIGTTTGTERKRNEEIEEANSMQVSIRQLRLIKAGIVGNFKFNTY